MPRTTTERIDNIQLQIQQLENERKRLMQQQKEQQRKARTKRLIERGAILESLVPGADVLTNEQVKTFLEKTVQSSYAKKILDNMTKLGGDSDAAKPASTAKGTG